MVVRMMYACVYALMYARVYALMYVCSLLLMQLCLWCSVAGWAGDRARVYDSGWFSCKRLWAGWFYLAVYCVSRCSDCIYNLCQQLNFYNTYLFYTKTATCCKGTDY